jgi:hypothetical protein
MGGNGWVAQGFIQEGGEDLVLSDLLMHLLSGLKHGPAQCLATYAVLLAVSVIFRDSELLEDGTKDWQH